VLGFLALPGIALAQSPVIENLQPEGLNHAGIYALRQLDPNLTGAGVKFALVCRSITYDEGKPQHDPQQMTAGVSSHSTAVCSILFGRDPNAYNEQIGHFYYEGAAPEAQADIYEFWHFLSNNVFSGSPPDVNVITADIGYQFEDWWTRGMDAMAQQYGKTIVVGIGNGSNASDPALFPGAGANVIGVGVVKSLDSGDPAEGLSRFALVYPEYSSQGPTSDGRSKPDIVAPGNCLAAVEDGNYEPTGSWSSFATPVVAGTAGLLIQKASSDPNLRLATSRDGGNCVVKALLLNSATKLPYWHKGRLTKDDDHEVPLDWLQGAGLVNAFEAYSQLLAGRHTPGDCPLTGWDLNKLDREETPAKSYRVNIAEPAGKMITATVVWNKNYADFYPFEHESRRDCDIRLELWAVDANDPNNDYLLDYSDSRTDNVEHIYCPADANTTEYEIVVSYSDDYPFDSAQGGDVNQPEVISPYGLCWNVSQKPQEDDFLWLDLNADGVVNNLDVSALLENIMAGLENPDRCLLGDINSDGRLDAKDLNIFLNRITPPPPVAANEMR
jgi:hypothetical protein